MLLVTFIIRRFIHQHHSRLALAVGFGMGIALGTPGTLSSVIRALIGWDAGVWLYLLLMAWLMATANNIQVCKIAQQEYRSRKAELILLLLAAFASLAAITFELTTLKTLTAHQRLLHYAFTGITVAGSWSLTVVLFTLHYAYLYYTSPSSQPELMFSDKEPQPNYWDFLYLALTIAVAAQTSDVMVMTRRMRKTVMAQSILSFVFNFAIIGLSINIVAGLMNA